MSHISNRTRWVALALVCAGLVSFRIPVVAQMPDGSSRRIVEKVEQLVRKLETFSLTVKPNVTVAEGQLRSLLIDRYDTAVRKLKAQIAGFKAGTQEFTDLDDTFEQVRIAAEELSANPCDLIPFLEFDLEIARTFEEHQILDEMAGRSNRASVEQARYHRLDAEIRLLRAQMKADKK